MLEIPKEELISARFSVSDLIKTNSFVEVKPQWVRVLTHLYNSRNQIENEMTSNFDVAKYNNFAVQYNRQVVKDPLIKYLMAARSGSRYGNNGIVDKDVGAITINSVLDKGNTLFIKSLEVSKDRISF